MKRPTHPHYIQDEFGRDVAEHQMTILLDQGLYRHLRFARTGTGIGHFDLVTWPGHLAFGGDRDTFTFARVPDMFGFFRSPDGRINPDYWAEKITDGRDRCTMYSTRVFREQVAQEIADVSRGFPGLADAVKAALDGFCPDYDDETEDGAREFLRDFTHEEGGRTFGFGDACSEWGLRGWDYHYLWACHAIVWGIRRYDARELTPEQWLETSALAGTTILDYDGWTQEEWSKPVTRKDFERRLSMCTISVAAPAASREATA